MRSKERENLRECTRSRSRNGLGSLLQSPMVFCSNKSKVDPQRMGEILNYKKDLHGVRKTKDQGVGGCCREE